MALDHYLPATYLAGFSSSEDGSRRERPIWVGDLQNGRVFRTKVANVGAVNDLYTLVNPIAGDHRAIDRTWTRYEGRLAAAIDELTTVVDSGRSVATIVADTWVRVLVPFVAGLFVRHPLFEARLDARLGGVLSNGDELFSPDNANGARILEMQRLLAPVLASRWFIGRMSDESPLITSDLGYAIVRDPDVAQFGFAIPLTQHHLLGVMPCRRRTLIRSEWMQWKAIIEVTPGRDARAANEVISSFARRFVFGPSREAIAPWAHSRTQVQDDIDPGQVFGLSHRHLVLHEFTWHRLASNLHFPGGDGRAARFEIDWDELAKDWCPPVYLPINMPRFESALTLIGGEIEVELYDLAGFTDRPGEPLPWEQSSSQMGPEP